MAVKTSWSVSRLAPVVCAVALAIAALQMLYVVRTKSITIDEIVLIPSAYYHLAARTPMLVNEHPPLVKLVAGLPLLLIQPDEIRPDQAKEPPSSPNGKWAYMESFWENNPTLFVALSFWPRVAVIGLAMLLGLATFRVARTLVGSRAAMIAVSFFAIEPTVLAHGRVVQTDIPAAFGFLLFIASLYRFWGSSTWWRAMAVGAAAAVAVLAKFSMLLTPSMMLAVWCWLAWARRRHSDALRALALHGALAMVALIVVIQAAYLFNQRPLTAPEEAFIHDAFAHPGRTWFVMTQLTHFLPSDFVFGIFTQIWHNRVGHAAGLLGEYRNTGWWLYFPIAIALKTPLPVLVLFLSGFVYGAWRAILGERQLLWLLVPALVYAIFLTFSRINIGVRYALPLYPLLFILSGWLIDRAWQARHRRWPIAAVSVLAVWSVGEAVRAFPDHMTYMNQLARGEHWRYLSDSNVEWGDDQRALAQYLFQRGELAVRGAYLGGFLVLHHYGIDYVDMMLAPNVKTRYVAIGASFLNGSTVPGVPWPDGRPRTESERVNTFDRFRHRTPEAVFGGSIYLFADDAVK